LSQPIHSKLLNMIDIELRPRSALVQSHAIVLGEMASLNVMVAEADDYDQRCSALFQLADTVFLLVEIEREFARREALHLTY
jgi:hypothetical protein